MLGDDSILSTFFKKHKVSFIKYICFSFLLFTFALNSIPLFAKSIHTIPIINTLVSLITFNEYETSNDNTFIKYAHISGIDDPIIEKKINGIIDDTIFNFLKQQGQYDPTYANNTAQYINYSIYYADNKMVSFSIENTQILASSYIQKKFFTIDVETSNVLLVSSFLGKDYQAIIKKQVIDSVNQDIKNNHMLYFTDKVTSLKITDQQPFYINKNNKVVVCFDKYQIAPGYMGCPEFILI